MSGTDINAITKARQYDADAFYNRYDTRFFQSEDRYLYY